MFMHKTHTHTYPSSHATAKQFDGQVTIVYEQDTIWEIWLFVERKERSKSEEN